VPDDPAPPEVLGSGPDDTPPGLLARVPRPWRVALGVVAAGALALTVGPGLVSNDPVSGETPAAAAPSADAREPVGPPPETWPVRGNLAGDRAYLRAVLARVKRDHPDAQRVLYAATLPDGGSVAFVGRDRDEAAGTFALDVYAIRVPPGSRVSSGTVSVVGRGLIESTGLLGWAGRGDDGRVYAVLLGPPRILVGQVSGGIRYAPDGSAVRQWRDVRGGDGSAVVDLGPRTDPALFARSRRSRVEVPIMMPLREPGRVSLDIEGLGGPSYDGPAPGLVGPTAVEACRGLIDLSGADVRVIWSGPVLREARAALLRIRRPDGPAFQLLVGEHGGAQPFAHGPLRVPWEVADVVPWLFESGDPLRPLHVLNPSGRGTVTVGYPGEPPRVVQTGPAGIAALGIGGPSRPNLYQAVVEVRSPDDRVVVKAPISTVSAQDPFLLDL